MEGLHTGGSATTSVRTAPYLFIISGDTALLHQNSLGLENITE